MSTGIMDTSFALAWPFSEGAVLQRGGCLLWGTAAPRASHRLGFQGRTFDVVADASGQWRLEVAAEAGGPFVLSRDGEVLRENLWVGDVWFCGGQSNMERSLEACAAWPSDALELRGDPGIRQLCLPNQFDFVEPRESVPGAQWIGAESSEVVRISAVGFHFATQLRQRTGVPQGLILAAVGGSTVQAWLSARTLEAFPECRDELKTFASPGWLEALRKEEEARRTAWWTKLEAEDPKDPRRAGSGEWTSIFLPSRCEPPLTGSQWFQKDVVLEDVGDGSGRLHLGTLVDSDDAWVNGTWVGSTAYQYPTRRYAIPPGVLKKGSNQILLRLVAPQGNLGATPDKAWSLVCATGSVDLSGPWKTRTGASAAPLAPDVFLPLISGGLHNGLLAPLAPLRFRAVLWYQGESNTHGGPDYGLLMKALLGEWRQLFGRADLPFLVVQLPLFGPPSPPVPEDGWANVRDAQRRLRDETLEVVVALDAGEWNDIHPGRKHLVGQRLALAARHLVLGEDLDPWTGPLYASHRVEGSSVVVEFEQTGEGLSTSGGAAPTAFELAGDGPYFPARCTVEAHRVVLECPSVPRPRRVRYAWAANPLGASLVNSVGLPASPFEA